jgi:predicted thioesterase
MPLEPGMAHEVQYVVGPGMLASDMGNAGVDVLATPTIFWMVEDAATKLVTPCLPAGQSTVGASVALRHLAATPPGMAVRARATLRQVKGRHLHFAVEMFDEREKIAEAEHERVIVDLRRFLDRVAQKQSRVPSPESKV